MVDLPPAVILTGETDPAVRTPPVPLAHHRSLSTAASRLCILTPLTDAAASLCSAAPALGLEQVHQRFIDAGAARVLLKPVRLDALKELRGLISDTASASGEGRDSRSLSAGGGRPAEDDGSALEWAMRGKGGGPGPPPVKVRSASDI